jgi:hypothetical protein
MTASLSAQPTPAAHCSARALFENHRPRRETAHFTFRDPAHGRIPDTHSDTPSELRPRPDNLQSRPESSVVHRVIAVVEMDDGADAGASLAPLTTPL